MSYWLKCPIESTGLGHLLLCLMFASLLFVHDKKVTFTCSLSSSLPMIHQLPPNMISYFSHSLIVYIHQEVNINQSHRLIISVIFSIFPLPYQPGPAHGFSLFSRGFPLLVRGSGSGFWGACCLLRHSEFLTRLWETFPGWTNSQSVNSCLEAAEYVSVWNPATAGGTFTALFKLGGSAPCGWC